MSFVPEKEEEVRKEIFLSALGKKGETPSKENPEHQSRTPKKTLSTSTS